ncbi:hydrolase [Pyxidicoccus fallax]|uniref:Hydrolase n=1 Tax=Pyxidicoccus fallax TaxID=394095 RepID=A0A848M156_9BACT|nr:M57 family metalloprotease [Pyxidicoccus fallax]NMO23104.1 hydrolase [Pyxidicoccus fallax]NPC85723.1 hydrolase [Pyxidicoccus fallax]
MFARSLVLAAGCIALMSGCAEPLDDETQEIVGNLVKAGFPADDIMVVDGKVYVGRDAEVTLAASREMIEPGKATEEQYRTNNLISASLTKICVDGSSFTGAFSTALDLAIQNYDELPLTFAMARTPSTDCSYTINAVIQPGVVGGSAGFPSSGLPYHTINIGGGLSSYSVDVIEHVITHELGHTIGFRHSDYYNRSISCGSGGNEGDAGVGAIHIPGTPTTAVVGGSLMNSCFRSVETGEFAASDITALTALYSPGVQNEFYYVRAKHSNKCLHVHGGGFTNGDSITQWDCLYDAHNTQWAIAPVAAGSQYYYITSRRSGKCAHVHGGVYGNGAGITQWTCLADAYNTQWELIDSGDPGYFYMRSRATGQCAQVNGGSLSNGGSISQWDCMSSPHMLWKMERVW